jgi:hypothetical protein
MFLTISLTNIVHDSAVQTIFLQFRVGLQNCFGLLLGAHSCDNRVTPGEEDLENMRGDEAATTCHKYARHIVTETVILAGYGCLEKTGLSG